LITLPGYLVAFSFLSALLYFFSIAPLRRVRRAKQWREIPCVILSSSVEEDATDSGLYRVLVTYRFEAGDRAYVATRYSFAVGATAGYRGKRTVVARLPPGTRTVCYVNPANPGDAVLERGVTWDMVFVSVLMVVMLGAFFFFAWHEVRG
jgi:uncharacterized protein DUF3592